MDLLMSEIFLVILGMTLELLALILLVRMLLSNELIKLLPMEFELC